MEKREEKWYLVTFVLPTKNYKCVKALNTKDAIKKLKAYHKKQILAHPKIDVREAFNYTAKSDDGYMCSQYASRKIINPK